MRSAASLSAFYRPYLEAGQFSFNGVTVPLVKGFYGIVPLDSILSHIMVAFTHVLSFPADREAYWHLMLFLMEFGGIYSCCLMESVKPAYKNSWLRL
jgi:hypothetical protein